MNEQTIQVLIGAAASIGFLHTIMGPDHYVPFIAMSRARGWSLLKTLLVTTACGLGHVIGSAALGCVGIALGAAAGKLQWFDDMRGGVAGWLLLGFGIAYTAWGIRRAIRNKPHSHWHVHADGTLHNHKHVHAKDHAHVHTHEAHRDRMTPWVLFVIFVFGPCEPLIPILIYPAAQLSVWGIVAVTVVFGACTLATMLAAVLVGYFGLSRISLAPLERYSHAVAGLTITSCGVLIHWGL